LVEGELFLLLTVQSDGMVVFSVLEPGDISGCQDGTGIVTHPGQNILPLFYMYAPSGETGEVIPSVNVLYGDYDKPEFYSGFEASQLNKSRAQGRGKYKGLKNFYRFIIHWPNLNGVNEGKRDTSYLRSILKYINYYHQSVLWSLDYRKSLASWSQKVKFSDDNFGQKAYRLWMKMTQVERDATGLTKPSQPGDKVFLMPGMDCNSMEHNAGKAGTGENTDVRNLLASGMDSLPDVLTADSKGSTFASIRETRNPFADVVESMQTKFSRLIKYGVLAHVLYIKSVMDKDFQYERKVKVPYDVDKDGKVKTKNIKKKAFHLVDVVMPVLNVQNMEELAKGLLGSKHGSLDKSLGIPPSVLAERMGFPDYHKMRVQEAFETEQYPKLFNPDEASVTGGGGDKQGEPIKKKEKTDGEVAKSE